MGQGLPPQSPAVTAPLLGELALRESFFYGTVRTVSYRNTAGFTETS